MQSFSVLQRASNLQYYLSGKNIYTDFKTFGGSKKVAEANAIEFCARMEEEAEVYEFGVGNGLFAYYFMEKVRRLKPNLKVNYYLCDISEKHLKEAEKKMKKFNATVIRCDVEMDLDFLETPDYIRSNELLDDLSTRFFVRKDENYEVLFGPEQKKEYSENNEKEVLKFMRKMPEGYEIPINFGAEHFLEGCRKKLDKNGWIDAFDYGFSSVDEIKMIPMEMWNNSVVREFNGQLTADVNFLCLERFGGKTEPQKDYAERVLGKRLYYVELEQLYYFDEESIKENRKKMKEFDYEDGFIFGGIDELDEYKRFRIDSKS